MKINISEIYNGIANLSFLIEEFEKNYLTLYKSYYDALSSWNDNNSIKFSSHLEQEKVKMENTYSEMQELNDVYKFIYDSYSKIGNKIYYKNETSETMLNYLDDCINEIQDILYLYNQLSLEQYSQESFLMNNQESEIRELLETMNEIKNDIRNVVDIINDTENTVGEKISKLNFEIIQESDVNEYI